MPHPQSKQDLRRFMAMVTYLGKFLPNLSTISTHLRQLLQEDILWHWTNQHSSAIQSIKKLITQSPVLKYFDPKLDAKLSVDASKSGLGGVLLQKHHNDWFPVTYGSRAMTPCERNYAQIEKETLAIVFGTEKFHDHLKQITNHSNQYFQNPLQKHHLRSKGSFSDYKGMTST